MRFKFLFISLLCVQFLFSFKISVFAFDSIDQLWIDRIEECKKSYGVKFKCNNTLYFILNLSKPYPQYGPTCRIRDYSVQENKDRGRVAYQKILSEICDTKVDGGSFVEGVPYFGATDFLELYYQNKKIEALAPEGFRKAVEELRNNCEKGFCENEGKYHGTVWLFHKEGALEIIVPTDHMGKKLFKKYAFLMNFRNAEKLYSLIHHKSK